MGSTICFVGMLPCPDAAKVDIFSHNRKKSITFYYTKPKKVLKTGCSQYFILFVEP
jgi:hypothetical protein